MSAKNEVLTAQVAKQFTPPSKWEARQEWPKNFDTSSLSDEDRAMYPTHTEQVLFILRSRMIADIVIEQYETGMQGGYAEIEEAKAMNIPAPRSFNIFNLLNLGKK